MPIVILLDVSLSMIRPLAQSETGDSCSILQLATHGINFFLDYLSLHLKLEFVSLLIVLDKLGNCDTISQGDKLYPWLEIGITGVTSWMLFNHFSQKTSGAKKYINIVFRREYVDVTFSSSYEVVSPFTRDFESIKSKLSKIEEHDKTCIEAGLCGVNSLILLDWGTSVPCQVILITDGNPGVGQSNLKQSISNLSHRSPHFPLPFPFPGKLHVICISPLQNPRSLSSLSLFQRLVEIAGNESGCVLTPEPGPLSAKSIQAVFQKLCDNSFSAFYGNLKCGNLTARISLSPVPQPYTKITDFETVTKTFSDTIDICGFIDIADIGSPMAVSRHLIVPQASGKTEANRVKLELDIDEEAIDEGKIPSFCVLLHGALKVENMAALCTVGDDWFGILYSWADSKKKSNLMLTVLEPGSDSVPWLGDLNYLGPLDEFFPGLPPNAEEAPSFPVQPDEKRSYSQNVVVWVRQAGLQSDIQKILRHARKLPDKTQQFYKELNRVRRAAISFGFVELLDGLAFIFERECTLLPGSAHPDCALQLTHAAQVLRRPFSRDIKYNITPMKTKFMSDNERQE